MNKIKACDKHREAWLDVAKECNNFFTGDNNFLWDTGKSAHFWHTKDISVQPTFRMQFNKAFEFVALIGPMLYNRNPVRTVTPRKALPVPQELLMPQLPPPMDQMQAQQQQQIMQQAQMGVMQVQQQQAIQDAQAAYRAAMMQEWLNYTPDEQPHGGLRKASQLAVTDALVKGRGVTWSELYNRPQSDKNITGSFYDSPENLYIDPDAERWDDVMWVCRKCTEPVWKVEKDYAKYGLAPGSLAKKAGLQSLNSQSEDSAHDKDNPDRKNGQTNDLLTYYKFWSRMGVGARLKESSPEVAKESAPLFEAIDRVVGDYAYIVVVPGVPYPLNMPTESLSQLNDEQVRSAFSWPVPFWKDNRWPCQVLDFYTKPGTTLPIAPLEPGIGELKFLNIMISHLANRTWMSSRDFIAVKKAASQAVKDAVRNGRDQAIIELEEIEGEIDNVVRFLQQPPVNQDVWRIMQDIMIAFDKRVGLSDLMYTMNPGGTQMRSAEEAAIKRSSMQIRPDYMAAMVEEWATESSRNEAMTTRWFITSKDVMQVLGPVAAQMWDQLIVQQDVDLVVGEMEYRIVTGTARKPDRDRDVANANQVANTLGAALFGYGQATGNFSAYNAMVEDMGKALDLDTKRYMLAPIQMQPVPQQAQPPA